MIRSRVARSRKRSDSKAPLAIHVKWGDIDGILEQLGRLSPPVFPGPLTEGPPKPPYRTCGAFCYIDGWRFVHVSGPEKQCAAPTYAISSSSLTLTTARRRWSIAS